ncbi:uncharacterized protein LOC132739345 [Ruditapes philippinarum]|uniref:uncharacterized protein LOC132739345 n=1 Tax=Ruditapes philippinarum TaxID=129788 RepID=UPI00295B4E70|nr:uncharacterized protein LOC132739345 [Ruditapes philippinarum]
MRLSMTLRIFYPKKKIFPGLKYEGKNQKIKPIKTSHKIAAVNKMMMEEQNLKYINNPYLSSIEENIYGTHFRSKQQRTQAFFEKMRKPFFPDKTIEDHYINSVYKQSKKWE